MRRIRHVIARGFTLIEIAFVMVVIGLLISGGLIAVTPILENSARSEVNTKMDIIEDALLVYAIQYNCLPCPANGTLATNAAGAGLAADSAGTYATGCSTQTSCRIVDNANSINVSNIVPYSTLGLSISDVVDPWGNYINYHVADQLILDGSASPGAQGTVRNGSTFPQATNLSGQRLEVGDLSDGGLDPTLNDVDADNIIADAANRGAAYVIVSNGPDLSTGISGERNGGVATAAGSGGNGQNENNHVDEDFVQDRRSDGAAGTNYFDDILRFKTVQLIIQQCGSGACGNP